MEADHVDGVAAIAEVLPKIVQKAKSADDELVAFVRQRPLTALVTALALGYLAGRVASRFG
jgi:hypothetical protein